MLSIERTHSTDSSTVPLSSATPNPKFTFVPGQHFVVNGKDHYQPGTVPVDDWKVIAIGTNFDGKTIYYCVPGRLNNQNPDLIYQFVEGESKFQPVWLGLRPEEDQVIVEGPHSGKSIQSFLQETYSRLMIQQNRFFFQTDNLLGRVIIFDRLSLKVIHVFRACDVFPITDKEKRIIK